MEQLLERSSTSSDDYNFYVYNPSKVLPAIVAVLFGIVSIVHIFFGFRGRSWVYWWAFIVGCIGETLGYIARQRSAYKPLQSEGGLGLFAGQTLFIILSPSFLAASLYMAFGRLTIWVGEEHSFINPRKITKIFVTFDVISFFVQSAGGGLYATNNVNVIKTARVILIFGFLIQIVSFGVFFVLSIDYQRRVKRAGFPAGDWSKLLSGMYIGIFLILIRSIYRFIEYVSSGSGHNGYLLTHEAFFYALETLPVFLSVVMMAYYQPGKFGLPSSKLEKIDWNGNGIPLYNKKEQLLGGVSN